MVEIVFGVLGLVMLVGGKVPQTMFQLLFGKGYYDTKPATARKFGLLLLAPAPLIVLGIALAMVALGGEPEPYVPWVEATVLVLVAFAALKWARSFRKSELPEPKPAPTPVPAQVNEEAPKDVFELSDHEIRQKLGLEPPDPAALVPPPPPDPAAVKKWQTRRMMVIVIGILAGMGLPLIFLLASVSDGTLANRSYGDILAIFGITAFAVILVIVLIVFFANRTRTK
jgi:hypothetical protein